MVVEMRWLGRAAVVRSRSSGGRGGGAQPGGGDEVVRSNLARS